LRFVQIDLHRDGVQGKLVKPVPHASCSTAQPDNVT
jgi:hypothetical protein